MDKWYAIEVYRAHRGAGRYESIPAYIYAQDVVSALNRYKKMPGVKRSFPRFFPSVRILTGLESKNLEILILKEGKKSLKEAKASWYYPKSFY